MIDFDDIDEVATDRAFAGDALDDAALAALPRRDDTLGVLDTCLSLRRAVEAEHTTRDEDGDAARPGACLRSGTGGGAPPGAGAGGGARELHGQRPRPARERRGAREEADRPAECREPPRGSPEPGDAPDNPDPAAGARLWEAAPTEVHFKVFKDVLPMRLEREGMLPCEVLDIWEGDWGVAHVRQLKFAAPPGYEKRWLGIRTDPLPYSPEVVRVEGKGSVLYALTLAFTKHDERLQARAFAGARQRLKQTCGFLTAGSPDGADLALSCRREQLRPEGDSAAVRAVPAAEQVIRIE